MAFNKNAESATSIEDLGVAESDKIFDLLNKTAGQEIFTAHRVTSPMLFGIRVEGQLGGRTELIDASELFQNTYVNNRQQEIERMFNWIFPKMGVTVPLTLQRTEIITSRFSEATQTQNMSREEIREKMGLPSEEKKGSMQEVINALKALPDSVVNKVLDAMSKDELRALAALTPAVSMSTIHFSTQEEEEAAAVFSRFGVDRAKFRLLLRREARFRNDSEEVAHFAAADDELTNKQVVALDLLNKDPLITPDDLASALNVTLEEIGGILSYLEEAELIKTVKRKDKSGNTVLERKPVQEALRLLKEIRPLTRSIQVMYSYEGPEDDRNRPFCAKMLELDRLYSRADIEAISTKLGYSVWARRGGWYTDPKTGAPRPYCRHTWVSNVVVKNV
ncbi:hypothetical protein [Chitinophaga sp. MD30]|uniref:hypothetical protein n=1 Tax=Chitinophaga sp. MD30 TaxID=2033437 RepID=UPI0012FDE334|nr:hypothetical protein [Chitinophaga sp. MD30]